MTLFHYQYLDEKGRKKSAFLDAETLQEAKEALRSQNRLILSIQVQTKTLWSFFKRKKCRFQTQQLITFTTQLAGLLSAGLPLYESLLSLEEQYRGESTHPIFLSLCESIKKGSPLSDALGRFPDSFPPLFCALVRAGESVGRLGASLDHLAKLLTKQTKLKKQLFTALLYPLVLFFFSGLVCLLMLTFVIPSLEALFEGRSVNRFTHLIFAFSHFIRTYPLLYIPLAVGGVFTLFYTLSNAKGRALLEKIGLRLPIIKKLIVEGALARFCRTLGTLLEGGVNLIQALSISRGVLRSPTLEATLLIAQERIVEGSSLSKELRKSSLVPLLVPRMLAIGEEGGSLALMLQKIADLYEEEMEKILTRVTALAQPVILVIMGGVIGLIMLAVLLPLTDVNAFI